MVAVIELIFELVFGMLFRIHLADATCFSWWRPPLGRLIIRTRKECWGTKRDCLHGYLVSIILSWELFYISSPSWHFWKGHMSFSLSIWTRSLHFQKRPANSTSNRCFPGCKHWIHSFCKAGFQAPNPNCIYQTAQNALHQNTANALQYLYLHLETLTFPPKQTRNTQIIISPHNS